MFCKTIINIIQLHNSQFIHERYKKKTGQNLNLVTYSSYTVQSIQ
jgi:hypothetical protein